MTHDPYPLHDHEHPHAHDVPEDAQVFDLMWHTGHSLYDALIWMRDHATSWNEADLHGEEADLVARDMEDAALSGRETQWRAYAGFARRRDEVLHAIENASRDDAATQDETTETSSPG